MLAATCRHALNSTPRPNAGKEDELVAVHERRSQLTLEYRSGRLVEADRLDAKAVMSAKDLQLVSPHASTEAIRKSVHDVQEQVGTMAWRSRRICTTNRLPTA